VHALLRSVIAREVIDPKQLLDEFSAGVQHSDVELSKVCPRRDIEAGCA